MIGVKSLHHSVPLISFFFLFLFYRVSGRSGSALSCRRWGVNASMKDGSSSITPWLVPTCPTFWDMCSELFGEIKEDELVPGQFDSPPTKKLHTEVEKEETKVGEAAGVINPSRSTTKVYTDQLLIPHDLGVPANYLPHWESVKKEGAKGGHKSVSYYSCLFCDHRSHNRTSITTHTHCHLNVVATCCLCPFTSESTGPLENHIKDVHGGKFLEEQLTDMESAELVTKH